MNSCIDYLWGMEDIFRPGTADAQLRKRQEIEERNSRRAVMTKENEIRTHEEENRRYIERMRIAQDEPTNSTERAITNIKRDTRRN